MIIDAHMHLPSGEPDLDSKRRRLLSDIRANGVDIGIVISDSELESSIGSMDDCAELFSDCPNVFVVAGISPYISYGKQLEKLKKYLTRGFFVGIKLYCGHEPIYIDCGDLKPIFGLAAEYDIPVLFHSGWDNAQYAAPERVKAAAAANPDVRLICYHCYYPKLAECFETLKSCSYTLICRPSPTSPKNAHRSRQCWSDIFTKCPNALFSVRITAAATNGGISALSSRWISRRIVCKVFYTETPRGYIRSPHNKRLCR